MALLKKKISAAGLADVITILALRDLPELKEFGVNPDQLAEKDVVELYGGYLFYIWLALSKKYDSLSARLIMDLVREKLIKSYLDALDKQRPGLSQGISISDRIVTRINEYCEIFSEEGTGGDALLKFSIRFHQNFIGDKETDIQKILGFGIHLEIFHKVLVDLLNEFKVTSTI
jgi:hypothetical protein